MNVEGNVYFDMVVRIIFTTVVTTLGWYPAGFEIRCRDIEKILIGKQAADFFYFTSLPFPN